MYRIVLCGVLRLGVSVSVHDVVEHLIQLGLVQRDTEQMLRDAIPRVDIIRA